jgi:hypothetical protein
MKINSGRPPDKNFNTDINEFANGLTKDAEEWVNEVNKKLGPTEGEIEKLLSDVASKISQSKYKLSDLEDIYDSRFMLG